MKPFLITAFVALPSLAPAATFDFGAIGTAFDNAQGFEGSWEEVTGGSIERDGVTVTATTDATYIHFDSSWRLGPDAGIGPCGIADCNRSGEDGFGPDETITLLFSEPVSMTSLLFRQSDPGRSAPDPDHTPAEGSFLLDGVTRSVTGGVAELPPDPAASWDFGYAGTDYYIETMVVEPLPPPSVIPLPASAWLLVGALGAAAAASRRRGTLPARP